LDPKSNNFIILSNLFQLIKYDARNGWKNGHIRIDGNLSFIVKIAA
jgi:hypothetical protein